jgi:hypothetical protein
MANPSSINSGVGFRHSQILRLDANGIIYATGTTAYEGIEVTGGKTLTINDPEPRQIVHVGDDSIFALDVLPPVEPISGELSAGKTANALDALLSNVNEVTVGESLLFPIGTNRRGDEATVAMLAFRQALDTDPASGNYGKRVWQLRLFPRCYVIPRESGFEDNAEERMYTIRPQFVTKYPWGVTLALATEGAVRIQGARGISEYKPKLLAWVTNNTQTQFTFPTNFAAATTGKIKTWLVNTTGVGAVSTATTLTTTTISYSTAPTTGTLVAWYETN